MNRLSGKTALVTGGSRGIGAAIVRRLAAEGANVAINYANSAKAANELAAEITKAGGKAKAFQADISRPEDVKRLLGEVHAALGTLDILVNNAGVWDNRPLAEVTPDFYERLYKTNVFAHILVSAEALRHFGGPERGGRIISISSVAADIAIPNGSVYSSTKAAINALTVNWAAELGPRKITVNAVAPGVTETEMVAAAPEAFKAGAISKTPLGRLGRPDDIADVVAFLSSDEARWVTGQVIRVSGGLSSA